MGVTNMPVSSKILEEAIAENPEYFPDEVEYRAKWDKIPQHVHDNYQKEMDALKSEVYKDMPHSKGILGWIKDPTGLKEWESAYDKCRKIEEPLAAALHKKFYSQYGF